MNAPPAESSVQRVLHLGIPYHFPGLRPFRLWSQPKGPLLLERRGLASALWDVRKARERLTLGPQLENAPAGAPRYAPSAPAGTRRRVPPASQSGLLAAFILRVQGCRLTQSGRTSEGPPTHRGNRRHGSTLAMLPESIFDTPVKNRVWAFVFAPTARIPALVYYASQFLLARARLWALLVSCNPGKAPS